MPGQQIRIDAATGGAEDPRVIDVVCALIEDPERGVLACKRPGHSHLAGYWEFPGGKIEPGEPPESALVREIEEELDAIIRVGAALQPVEWSDGSVSIRLLPYRCAIISGTPHPHEHEEIRWCSLEETDHLEWAPADRPILAEWRAAIRPE